MVEVLTEPGIANLKQAISLAQAVQDADAQAEVGPVLDKILKFLSRWQCSALRVNEDEVDELFRALGDDRAIRSAGWLARRAGDWDTFLFWERAVERFCRWAEEAEERAAAVAVDDADSEHETSVASETDDEQLTAAAHTPRSYSWWSRGLRQLPR